MRFTIVLALCFIGVVSAGSLNKRSFLDDLQNNTQNAFHAFEQFGQNFNDKVQEALKNLFNAFGNKTENTESVSVSKRATNPLVLINDLSDPAKFAQDLMKVLADMALGQGKRKREIFDDIKKFSEEAKHNAEQALKNLFSLFEQFQHQSNESSDAVNVTKRATNPLVLINDLSDPAKFAQDFFKVLADMALGQGRRKRATNPLVLINDLSDPAKFAQDFFKVLADMATGQGKRKREILDDIKKFSEEAKINAEQALKNLFSLFERFQHQSSESSDAVNVAKRATNPLVLINDLSDPAKFAQDFFKVLADMALGQGRRKRATNPLVLINDLSDPAKFAQDFFKVLADMALGQGKRKRDISEDFKKLADSAKQNAEEGLKKLFEFLEQFKNQFAHDETDAEKVVEKRDIQETLEKFNKLAQTKAQEAIQNIQKAIADLFNASPFFQSVSSHPINGEDSTENSVSN